jgi:hypothetical protein
MIYDNKIPNQEMAFFGTRVTSCFVNDLRNNNSFSVETNEHEWKRCKNQDKFLSGFSCNLEKEGAIHHWKVGKTMLR